MNNADWLVGFRSWQADGLRTWATNRAAAEQRQANDAAISALYKGLRLAQQSEPNLLANLDCELWAMKIAATL